MYCSTNFNKYIRGIIIDILEYKNNAFAIFLQFAVSSFSSTSTIFIKQIFSATLVGFGCNF